MRHTIRNQIAKVAPDALETYDNLIKKVTLNPHYEKRISFATYAESLITQFVWAATDEGYDYWCSVNDRIYNYQ